MDLSQVGVDAIPVRSTDSNINEESSQEAPADEEAPAGQPGQGSNPTAGETSSSSQAPPSNPNPAASNNSAGHSVQKNIQNIQVVNIGSGSFVNASNVNILSNVYHNCPVTGVPPSSQVPPVPSQLSPQVQALLEDSSPTTPHHILGVSLDRRWRQVMRRLGLSDADIDTTSETHLAVGNVQEAVYQCFRLWLESRGSDATVASLSSALYHENQVAALEQLAQGNSSS